MMFETRVRDILNKIRSADCETFTLPEDIDTAVAAILAEVEPVREDERIACAKVCDGPFPANSGLDSITCAELGKRIRNRGTL